MTRSTRIAVAGSSPSRGGMDAQTMTLERWHPPSVANGAHGSWRARVAKRRETLQQVGWQALIDKWRRVPGKARLEIVLVYPRKYRVDTDNLYSRCKDAVDALKDYMVDDSTDWLELHVSAVVEKGVKETRLTLSPVQVKEG